MLPVWALVTPTVMYGLLKYLVCLFTRGITSRVLHSQRRALRERQVRVISSPLSPLNFDKILAVVITIAFLLHF